MSQIISPALVGGVGGGGSAEPFFFRFFDRFEAGVDRLFATRHWKIRAVLAILTISLFRAFPSYGALRTPFVAMTWASAEVKFAYPMADMGRIFAAGTHESNVTYRLTVPAIAHGLHLDQTGLLVLFAIAGVALLYLLLQVVFSISGSKRVALFIALATSCVWPGIAAFHELRGGYYDAVALCLIVGAFASNSSAVVSAALVFLTAWTDERALMGGAFLLLFYVMRGDEGRGSVASSRRSVAAVSAGMAAYVGIRLWLAASYSYAGGGGATGGIGFGELAHQIHRVPLAIWSGLGGCWFLVVLAVFVLFQQKRFLAASAFCGLLVAATGTALLVVDMTRGMAYCLPSVFVALAILRNVGHRRLERMAVAIGAVSLVVPTLYLEGGSGLWWLHSLPVQVVHWLS